MAGGSAATPLVSEAFSGVIRREWLGFLVTRPRTRLPSRWSSAAVAEAWARQASKHGIFKISKSKKAAFSRGKDLRLGSIPSNTDHTYRFLAECKRSLRYFGVSLPGGLRRVSNWLSVEATPPLLEAISSTMAEKCPFSRLPEKRLRTLFFLPDPSPR